MLGDSKYRIGRGREPYPDGYLDTALENAPVSGFNCGRAPDLAVAGFISFARSQSHAA
jgi:hypothetical protein